MYFLFRDLFVSLFFLFLLLFLNVFSKRKGSGGGRYGGQDCHNIDFGPGRLCLLFNFANGLQTCPCNIINLNGTTLMRLETSNF